jgi:type IV pilus assembly protein PilC
METGNITHLDLDLTRDDQERIRSLRQVDLDEKKKSRGLKARFIKLNKWTESLTRIKLREKVTFFQLMAVMINAGVPIIRCLYVLSDQNPNPKLKNIIRALGAQMEEGSSLSKAMAQHSDLFSESERGMISSGEASGNLNEILKDIAKQAEKGAQIISKVKGAMAYPTAIMAIMLIAVVLMLTLVVPKISALFTQSSQELPLSTKILIGASEYAQHGWVYMILGALVFSGGFYVFSRQKRGKYLLHFALLYVPIFGKLMRELMIARFTRVLASLLNSGIPIVKALEITSHAVGNEVYKQRIDFASQDVAQGIPLGENLTDNSFLFPPMVASMVLVGEQTANLVEVCNKIADFYETEVDNMVSTLSKLMEPIILVVMGGTVGFVVAAIMQPIMALSDISSVV